MATRDERVMRSQEPVLSKQKYETLIDKQFGSLRSSWELPHTGHGRRSYTVAYHGGRVEVMLRKKAFRPKADCQGHALQASQCLGCSMFGFSFADFICFNGRRTGSCVGSRLCRGACGRH